MQRFFLVSAASLGLLAAAGPVLAVSTEEALKTATAACLDSAGKQGWRTDLAKVISSRSIDADKVEVVFDLTKDGTNTARLTCPYSLSKGVATTFGGPETPAETTPAPVETTTTTDTGTGVNPWWLLLPLGLGLLSWAALRGKTEDVATNPGTTYSGSYTNTSSTVTTGTSTSRNIFVEANAHDGQLEVREHADVNSAVLRRVRNGENVQLTGHRRNDWLEVANGGWVRDIDVRYDRTTVRFS
ncbi:SH3 domain-containing protein [Vulcanococcus limneticus]|uniref:SH3 domain-containing protein n=1 Tax=Vulcanococcus limneticus TaxID=2170428 RepID=UPI00398BC673